MSTSTCYGGLSPSPGRATTSLLTRAVREPLAPLYSARHGNYRALYRIEDDRLVVEIVTIEHRRDAYHRR